MAVRPSVRAAPDLVFSACLHTYPPAGSRMGGDGDNFSASKNKLIAAGVELGGFHK